MLALTDLTGKKDNYVEELSTGMKQRLCLAKTLIHDPKVLLLDEPASGLDPRARIEIKELFKELKAMGKTIIISSHILPELADFCNKVGIIERGQMLIEGDVQDIMAQVVGGKTLEIKLLDGHDKATELLEASPHVRSVRPLNSHLHIDFTGDRRRPGRPEQTAHRQRPARPDLLRAGDRPGRHLHESDEGAGTITASKEGDIPCLLSRFYRRRSKPRVPS